MINRERAEEKSLAGVGGVGQLFFGFRYSKDVGRLAPNTADLLFVARSVGEKA